MYEIDHVGILVSNIEEYIKTLNQAFGALVEHDRTQGPGNRKIYYVEFGNALLELIEDDESEQSQPAQARLDHIAIGVDDVAEEIKLLKQKEFDVQDERPRIGAFNRKVAALNEANLGGVKLHLVEKGR